MKRPAYQWYPGDWDRDTALQACSFEARALWRQMLDYMHSGEPYGHLTAAGVPITPVEIARMIGKAPAVVKKWLAELETRKVFTRTEDGVIYSRRMVRDEHIRNTRAAVGKLGGNPALLVNQTDNQNPETVQPKANPFHLTTASLSSFSFPEVAVYGNRLTVAANQGLHDHLTAPQSVPRIFATSGSTHEIATELLAAGVPIEFAESAVYDLAKSHRADDAITSLKYFVRGVLRAWAHYQASEAARTADRPAPLPANDPRVLKSNTKGDAALVFGKIRSLVRESQPPGQAKVRIIPKADVAALGADVLEAYEAVGGSGALLNTPDDKLSFLITQFTNALEAARAAA